MQRNPAEMCWKDSRNVRKKHHTTYHVDDYLEKDDKGERETLMEWEGKWTQRGEARLKTVVDEWESSEWENIKGGAGRRGGITRKRIRG